MIVVGQGKRVKEGRKPEKKNRIIKAVTRKQLNINLLNLVSISYGTYAGHVFPAVAAIALLPCSIANRWSGSSTMSPSNRFGSERKTYIYVLLYRS